MQPRNSVYYRKGVIGFTDLFQECDKSNPDLFPVKDRNDNSTPLNYYGEAL